MQIPLQSGIVGSEKADFVQSYPINLEPVNLENGISKGYLRTASGARTVSTGPGIDRGAVLWNGVHYRVMGTKLVSVDSNGVITTLADVGGSGPVGMTYGFDRLAIRSSANLFYWNGKALTQVTNQYLGPVVDLAWLNGQYFTTDGTDVIATDISDPTNVNPTRYGAAESDPDMVTGLLPLRDEMYVLGGNTVEVQQYTGGANFPLTANEGATILKGCVSPQAKCRFSESFAFCGGGRNEQIGIYLADGATAIKLSTRTIDDLLNAVVDTTQISMESRISRDEQRLFVHLPTMSLVYLFSASKATQQPVWYIAASGIGMDEAYRPRNAVLAYGKFWVGDTQSAALGVLDDSIGSHFGDSVGWQFDTTFNYNQGKSAIIHQFELVGLWGRGVVDAASVLWSYTKDGATWSLPRANKLPREGGRTKRIVWNPHTRFRNYLGMRFKGDSNSLAGIAALNLGDGDVEPLSA